MVFFLSLSLQERILFRISSTVLFYLSIHLAIIFLLPLSPFSTTSPQLLRKDSFNLITDFLYFLNYYFLGSQVNNEHVVRKRGKKFNYVVSDE